MEDYFKQNANRHKSEKMLDKFILKTEKKECEKLENKLKQIEKINEVSLNRKKFRSDQDSEKEKSKDNVNSVSKASLLKEKIKKINQDKTDKNSQIDVDYSLEKILKHITNRDKFTKCLKLLKDLVSSKLDNFIPISLIKAFYIIIYTIPFKFQEKDDRISIEGLFNLVDGQSFELFDSDEKKIWESFHIPIKFQLKLFTDDSFTFSGVMKQVDKSYSELSNYNEKEEKLIKLFEKMNRIIKSDNLSENGKTEQKEEEELEQVEEEDYTVVFKEIDILGQSLRRKFVFDCFKQAFLMHKLNWASVPINTIFKKAYMERVKFSPSQNSELENMINIMKNNSGSLSSVDNLRQKIDERIKNNPLESYYKVSDSRSEVAVLGDGSTWEAKQTGLTASKMYINH